MTSLSEAASERLEEARAKLRAGLPAGQSLVDQLIKERREEFLREMVHAVPLTRAEIEALQAGGANLEPFEGDGDPELLGLEALVRLLMENLSAEEMAKTLNLEVRELERRAEEQKSGLSTELISMGPDCFHYFNCTKMNCFLVLSELLRRFQSASTS